MGGVGGGGLLTKTCLVWWGFEIIGENQQGRWESARLEGSSKLWLVSCGKGGTTTATPNASSLQCCHPVQSQLCVSALRVYGYMHAH